MSEAIPRVRRLVVNADDFGFTRDVNEGIAAAHRDGILTATTLMANGGEFAHAVEIARRTPSLDVGCHLVLVGGPSLSRPAWRLPASVARLAAALAGGQLSALRELDAQIARILDAGIRPTHLDTHKHVHLFPQVLDALAELSRRYGIRWVRRPFDFPLPAGSMRLPLTARLTSRSLGFLRSRFHRVLHAHGCRMTDHFAGFQLTGRFRARELAHLIHHLPVGVTEFMCHPGYCSDELRGAPTRLKESRQNELEALCSREARDAVREAGVALVSFRDL